MALTMLDLRADAIAEAERVANARRFHRDGDAPALERHESGGPLVTRARRTHLRRLLGRRILVIWHLRCDSAAGSASESCLVAVLVDVDQAPQNLRHRAWIRAFVRNVDLPARRVVDQELAHWREAATTIAGRFVSARVARERAIGAQLAARPLREFQGGLFDRRVERGHRRQTAATTGLERQSRDRLAAALEGVPTSTRLGELLLVLTP